MKPISAQYLKNASRNNLRRAQRRDAKIMSGYELMATQSRQSGYGKNALHFSRAFHGVTGEFLPEDYADKRSAS